MTMSNKLGFDDKIGVLDPSGQKPNPLTNSEYSENYRDLAKVWSTFPAFTKAKEILESIRNNQITFIVSTTGTGKSVLLPKFALHYLNYQGSVVMTLPKRVLAYSAADFAAKTLDVKLGKDIGYVFKGSPKDMAGPDNKITYMTDGVLIMKFTNDPILSDVNIVIIDEAHELKVTIDLILLLLKRLLLSGKRPDLRVIIMSATIDTAVFQKYFSGITSKVINIAGKPNYPIDVTFLEKPSNSYMVDGMDIIDGLIGRGIKDDMLFFITTSAEAKQLCKSIRQKYAKVYCIELYADMDKNLKIYAESRDKFLELGNYDQKLVMATNVAESSITIDGLKYVIDSAYELYSYFDPNYFGQVLEKRLISKAQAMQRRGRVGRTGPGHCYHLLTKKQYEELDDYPTPEILRSDISMEMLKLMRISESQSYRECTDLLGQLMDTPKKAYIDAAHELFELYHLIDDNGKISKTGKNITEFSSIAINRSLFLIYAFELKCAREASIILAMMDVLDAKLNNLFFKADTMCESGCEKPASQNFIKTIAQRSGDHLTFLRVFQEFKDTDDQKTWARKYGIRLDTLKAADRLVNFYYYKMVNLSKPATQSTQSEQSDQSNQSDQSDKSDQQISDNAQEQSRLADYNTKRRITDALKRSHLHLTAKNMIPYMAKKEIEGKINKDSVIHRFFNRKELATKTFIYDELIQINGAWEFSTVTLI